MNKDVHIGLIFADSMEFMPFADFAEKNSGERNTVFGFNSVHMTFKGDKKNIEVTALESGIGKVCAACAATTLISCLKCDRIIIAGLSGAVSGCVRGDIIAGAACCECDLDLTGIGFEPGKKPGYPVMYEGDGELLEIARGLNIKTGILGTGDVFLTDSDRKQYFHSAFGINSFDMESAAAASVCHKYGIPLLSIRKISDDADDCAADDYRDMNILAESSLTEIISRIIYKKLSE